MIVDASAIVAIMRDEPDSADLARRLASASSRLTHALSVYEATVAIARLAGSHIGPARAVVEDFLADMEIEVAEVAAAEAQAALEAFTRYGKGHHPAKLNMGDCFSYAFARTQGLPLLYKGDGFAQTDLA